MKNILWLLLMVSHISFAQNSREYPLAPVNQLTPGKLCDIPVKYRYPEQIAYCGRDVTKEQKDYVFQLYNSYGFRVDYINKRSSYKIDHYVPLCAGGSNDIVNLWPQHISIANVTDSIEKLGCDKMALGKVTQQRFVYLIMLVKNDLRYASTVSNELGRL